MGRWAEVYFTSPPERREQAVLELLHELQGQNTAEGSATISPASAQEETVEPVSARASEIPKAQVAPIRCHACGRQNPATHRFCGMCGTSLGEQPEESEAGIPGRLIEDSPSEDPTPHAQDHDDEAAFVRAEEAIYEPALSTSELSLFQRGRERSYRDDREEELFSYSSARRSYRVYVGIALAMVIFALGYMAWRSAQATSQNSHVEPQAPPAVTQPVAPATAPPSAAKTEMSGGAPPTNQQAADPPQPVRNDDTKTVTEKSDHAAAGPAAPAAEAKPPETSLTGNGAEELAIAQRYLTGSEGLHRNAAEAAKWLWKSMGKHNANATLLLADLYLKGDGVSKNCDQARVLLDSAARSGMKEAGDRLRHLQSFGCE
jgi:TPR repeat protein